MSAINTQTFLLRILWIATILLLNNGSSSALFDQSTLSCSDINCPPIEEIDCPDDSHKIDSLNIHKYSVLTNNSLPYEEEYDIIDQCCLPVACLCNTCNLPDCDDGSFVYETKEEYPSPGYCCGSSSCISHEPNCTETPDTDGQWLYECKRCQCKHGAAVCEKECEVETYNNFCYVESKKKIYEDGEKWQMDTCRECECRNGEQLCVSPFCKGCKQGEYKFTIEGDCCPSCFVKVEDEEQRMTETTERKSTTAETTSSSTSSTTTTTSTTTSATTPASAHKQETPSISIESIETCSNHVHIGVLYGFIGLLVIICIYLYRSKAKKRTGIITPSNALLPSP